MKVLVYYPGLTEAHEVDKGVFIMDTNVYD